MHAELQEFPYSYLFSSVENGPETLRRLSTNGLDACDTHVLQVTGKSNHITPRSSPAAFTFGVGAGEMGKENIAEVSVDLVDEDFHARGFRRLLSVHESTKAWIF